MRIVHTAGWLLGIEMPSVHARSRELRAARLETVQRILSLAEREGANAVVAAGNVFADNRIDNKTVLELAELLAGSRIPTFLLPGIWDPYTADSPYRRHRERFPHVLLEPTPVADGTLVPIQHVDGASDGLRVVVACASPDELPEELDADYLALGSEPGPQPHRNGWYPGSPEPTDFGQAGRALLVDVASGEVTPHDVSGHRWVELERDAANLEAVEAELQTLERAQHTVLRLRLTGTLAEDRALQELEARLAARFFHVTLEDETLPALELPHLSALVDRLKAGADDPDTLRRALRKLRELA